MRENAVVTLERFHSLDSALMKLKKQLAQTGVFAAMKRHAFALKPGERRRLKQKIARSKARKAARRVEMVSAERDGR